MNLYYIFVNLASNHANYVSIPGGITNESSQAAIFNSPEAAQRIADAMPNRGPECIVMRCRMTTDSNRAQCERTRAYWQRIEQG